MMCGVLEAERASEAQLRNRKSHSYWSGEFGGGGRKVKGESVESGETTCLVGLPGPC